MLVEMIRGFKSNDHHINKITQVLLNTIKYQFIVATSHTAGSCKRRIHAFTRMLPPFFEWVHGFDGMVTGAYFSFSNYIRRNHPSSSSSSPPLKNVLFPLLAVAGRLIPLVLLQYQFVERYCLLDYSS